MFYLNLSYFDDPDATICKMPKIHQQFSTEANVINTFCSVPMLC